MGLSVLLSGSGIASTVLAYWLLKIPAITSITIVERDSTPRLTGQSIDIRSNGVDIVRAMGLIDQVKAHSTNEKGISFVDPQGKAVATFEATGDEKKQSFTSEYEIFRGELARIFYESVRDRVEVMFGDYIESYAQNVDAQGRKGVDVTFANSKATRRFDLVVAGDGLGSKVRGMILGQSPRESIKSLCTYSAGFTIRRVDLLEGRPFAKWYNATGGRSLLVRPDPEGNTRVTLTTVCYDRNTPENKEYLAAIRDGYDHFKKFLRTKFQDMGWIAERVLEEMEKADDFYASEIAQVKADKIYDGRVTLVGDAGYCPSPITGMGTTLAISGAYILAGEIKTALDAKSKAEKEGSAGKEYESQDPIEEALTKYQTHMIPYARSVQKLPPGLPQLVNPQTQWGVDVLRVILSWITWLKLDKLAASFSGGPQNNAFPLPKYDWN